MSTVKSVSTVKFPPVASRRTDDRAPDLTSMYVIHRAMLADLRRLVRACAEGRRAGPVRAYAAALLTEIDHHHANEDDLLWPIIERTAGHAVDLSPYTDDHQALGPLLGRCRASLERDLPALGRDLADLLEVLDEHIAEEESRLFPIIFAYVPYDAYAWVEKQVAKRATPRQLLFTAPWLLRHATPEEGARLLATAPAPLRLLITALDRRYARRERQTFG